MTVYVKNSGNWSLAGNIHVKNAGTWIEPQEVYIKDTGTWQLVHKVVTISANVTNLNLYSYVGSPSTKLRLITYINPGVYITSASSASASLDIGNFPAGSQVLLVNSGIIEGAAGAGGTGANYGGSATSGGAGGTAITTAGISGGNIAIDNHAGYIYGGGGGGGGGGYRSVTTSCFPAGTLITTPGGSKNIEDIQIGDTVLAYDINATGTITFPGVLVEKTVTQTFTHTWAQSGSVSPLIIIKHEHGTLTTTTNHEILTPSKQTPGLDQGAELGFAMASMLEVGDIIYTADGVESKILEITPGQPYDLVYNFEVSDVHTYIADGIRVHNGTPPTKGSSTTTYAGGGGGGGAGIANGAAGAGGGGANNNGAAGSAGSNSAP